jgi:putative methyltransferase (TIGR04325 family)
LKHLIKSLVPRKLLDIYHSYKYPKAPLAGWFGDYKTWEEAEAQCSGYEAGNILKKVRESVLKVKSGEAKYERDSVLFDEIQYSQPLIDALQSSVEENKLHVVDFGGSLGSSYFQHKPLFSASLDLKWSVVEQGHFVDCGKKEIADDHLSFFNTIDEALKQQSNQVLLLSSVLPYFKEPYVLMESLLKYRFKYIIIDRTAFIDGSKERITKQIVPESIYKASYPAWFFNEEKFVSAFSKQYDLLNLFDSVFDPVEHLEDGTRVYRKGFYFKLKHQ